MVLHFFIIHDLYWRGVYFKIKLSNSAILQKAQVLSRNGIQDLLVIVWVGFR
jgi:hypothetical protein